MVALDDGSATLVQEHSAASSEPKITGTASAE
jgi:hypothetical protein